MDLQQLATVLDRRIDEFHAECTDVVDEFNKLSTLSEEQAARSRFLQTADIASDGYEALHQMLRDHASAAATIEFKETQLVQRLKAL